MCLGCERPKFMRVIWTNHLTSGLILGNGYFGISMLFFLNECSWKVVIQFCASACQHPSRNRFVLFPPAKALRFLGIFIRMESMQGIGAGVLAQWKRSVRSLGTAGDLCLDFSFFFSPSPFMWADCLTLCCKCLCLQGCREVVCYHLLNDSSGFVTTYFSVLDSHQSLSARLRYLINEA